MTDPAPAIVFAPRTAIDGTPASGYTGWYECAACGHHWPMPCQHQPPANARCRVCSPVAGTKGKWKPGAYTEKCVHGD